MNLLEKEFLGRITAVTGTGNPQRGSLKVDPDVMRFVVKEQERLRELQGGKKPSYSEILRRMWQTYSAESESTEPQQHGRRSKATTPQTTDEELLVAALLMVMREKNEDALERVENLRLILKRRIEKVQAREPNNHVA